MPLVKPGRWSVNPADIDPAWSWFWKYAGHAAVYNEGAGAPFDYATRQVATVTNTDWSLTALGVGPRRDTTGERLRWSAREDFQLFGDVNFSVGIVLNKLTSNGGLIVARDGTDNGFWEFVNDSGTAVSFQWRVGGGQQSVNWTGLTAGSATSFFVARRVGGVYELWVDGVSQGTQTNTTAPATSRAHDLEIGRRGNNSASVLGTYLASYVWEGLALNDGLVQQLVQDPFGMFRPVLFITDVVDLTVTLLATGDGTIIEVVNELDAVSPLWSSIDDDIDSPDDSDWINNAIAPGAVEYFPLLTDPPEAFGVAVSATIRTRVSGFNFWGQSLTLFAQLYKADETTALSDEITVTTVLANSAFNNTAALDFTGLDTSAGKPAWVGAKVRYRWA